MYQLDPSLEGLVLKLEDGRNLGYGYFGNLEGFPLLYFHGFPGSRLEAKLLDKGMKNTPFKLIALDRPGIGLSSVQKNRSLMDWPKDVLEYVDCFNIEKFGIVGVSGGSPYALACAHQIPEKRLITVIIASGMGPLIGGKQHMNLFLRIGLTIADQNPKMLRALLYTAMLFHKTPKRAYRTIYNFVKSLPIDDQSLFEENSQYLSYLVADNFWAYVQGIEGLAGDVEIYTKPWGFDLSEIPKSLNIHILHGKSDNIVPFEMAEYMVSRIPNCKFYTSKKSHFSAVEELLPNVFDEVTPLFHSELNVI